jgi:hypothetical protein
MINTWIVVKDSVTESVKDRFLARVMSHVQFGVKVRICGRHL